MRTNVLFMHTSFNIETSYPFDEENKKKNSYYWIKHYVICISSRFHTQWSSYVKVSRIFFGGLVAIVYK